MAESVHATSTTTPSDAFSRSDWRVAGALTKTIRPPGRISGFRLLTYIVLSLAAVIYVFPFLWMLGKSLMTLFEATSTAVIPSDLQFVNYQTVLGQYHFGQYFFNTVILEVLTVTGQTVVSVLAAYAFARMKFPGRDLIFAIFLLTIFVPSIVLLVPNVVLVTNISKAFESISPSLKWLNNWPALVIPFLGNTFSIFLLRQFFKQIPEDLWDAARIDGASHLRYLVQVVVPLSRAAVLTTVLFAFIGTWNALEWPLLVTTDERWRPIAVGLQLFRQEGGENTHLLMAASVVSMVPILILYFITQKQFTEGITTTGLKG